MMKYYYRTFGLNFSSEIELPALIPIKIEDDLVDVFIILGNAPQSLPNCTKKGVNFELAAGKFLPKLNDIADFYVANGNKIVLSIKDRQDLRNVRIFLLGSCFGAILHQRNQLTLHASAIVHQGQAVIFTGDKGAGKSTTANALRLKGYKMLTDDVLSLIHI